MGRAPCCDEEGLKKGPWSPEEDKKLVEFIQRHGHGSWRALPKRAGLNRCPKSCRLRWTNYLRPDIKRGRFSEEEERLIIHLHSVLGNKWSTMATRLPGRTDNEIKNHWNTHLRKKLLRNGVDPVTHRPRPDLTLLANLPGLLAAGGLGNHLVPAPWGDALRVQADAAQLARIQLLQSLVQAITSNVLPPPSLDLVGIMSSAACLQNQQPGGDLLRGIGSPPGLLDSSLTSITDTTSGLLMAGFSTPQMPSDNQLLAQTLALEGGGAAPVAAGVDCFPSANVSSPSNQMSSSYVTPASTPSLGAASPLENPTMDPSQDVIGSYCTPAEPFEPWGVLAGGDSDYNWEDMLGHLPPQTWPTAL